MKQVPPEFQPRHKLEIEYFSLKRKLNAYRKFIKKAFRDNNRHFCICTKCFAIFEPGGRGDVCGCNSDIKDLIINEKTISLLFGSHK